MHRYVEIVVGVFVAIGLGALVLLSLQAGGIGRSSISGGYRINANFSNVGQLKPQAPVKLAGVSVGKVESIYVDTDKYEAIVVMIISPKYADHIPLDTGAGIYTSGLLGEQYILLSAGGDDSFLQDGDQIIITSDAVVLEDIIGQFLYSKAAGDD